MRRPALVLLSLASLPVLLAGCGGGDKGSASTPAAAPPSSATTSTAPSATPTTAPSTAAASPVALPKGCTPPSQTVVWHGGSASFEVTAGPDQGHYALSLDSSQSNEYAPDDKEVTGNWLSADKKAQLFIDIEGDDPCTPEAFTRIGTEGESGPVFADGGHTQCKVTVSSLSDKGVTGKFTCSALSGANGSATRDAKGTFQLLP